MYDSHQHETTRPFLLECEFSPYKSEAQGNGVGSYVACRHTVHTRFRAEGQHLNRLDEQNTNGLGSSYPWLRLLHLLLHPLTTPLPPPLGRTSKGEEPEVDQLRGEELEVNQLRGEELEVNQLRGEEPEVDQVRGEELEADQLQWEEPEVVQLRGEELEANQLRGEEL
ncbi:unnamed protein product [Gadus morhua 'NCC']